MGKEEVNWGGTKYQKKWKKWPEIGGHFRGEVET